MANALECGSTWPEWWARFDPDSCSWKTRQPSLFEDLEQSLEIWPRSGLMRRGRCFPLPTLERPMCERGSGLWPTPQKQDVRHAAPTPWELEKVKQGGQPHLHTALGWVVHPHSSEWLMGWPIGHTDLQPLETGKFQEWLRLHSLCWPAA